MNTPNIQPEAAPDPQNAQEWVKARIAHYEREIARLEKELEHARILLKGHQTWLADLQKQQDKAGRE